MCFLQIFDKELEKVERFEGLNDFVTSFKLHRGKWKGEDHEDDDIVGELKVGNLYLNRNSAGK